MFYTYILKSDKSVRHYIGHTSDLKERLNYHNSGRVKATRNKGPWNVEYYETFKTKGEANKREIEIKKKKSRKYIDS